MPDSPEPRPPAPAPRRGRRWLTLLIALPLAYLLLGWAWTAVVDTVNEATPSAWAAANRAPLPAGWTATAPRERVTQRLDAADNADALVFDTTSAAAGLSAVRRPGETAADLILTAIPVGGFLPATALGVEAVTLWQDGQPTRLPLANLCWARQPATSAATGPGVVTYTLDLAGPAGEQVRLARVYERSGPEAVTARTVVTNAGPRPLEVQVETLGPVGLGMTYARGDTRQVVAGLGEPANQVETVRRPHVVSDAFSVLRGFATQREALDWPLGQRDRLPVAWTALANRHEAAVLWPADAAGWTVTVSALMPCRDPLLEPTDLVQRVASTRLAVPPGGSAATAVTLRVGDLDRLSAAPSTQPAGLDLLGSTVTGGPCGLAWLGTVFGWVALPLQRLTGQWWLTLTVVAAVFTLAFWPVQRFSRSRLADALAQHRRLAPLVADLRTRHADDPARLQQELIQLYQSSRHNPFAPVIGCLPLAVEIPVWIALGSFLAGDPALGHEGLVPGLAAIITQPDLLWPFPWVPGFPAPFSLPVIGSLVGPILGLNLLPILVVVLVVLRQRQVPVVDDPTAATAPSVSAAHPRRAAGRTLWVSLVFLLLIYNLPSGLAFYMLVSSVLGLARDRWLAAR